MREGSPIADLYAVCNTCTCLQSELRGLLLEAHEVRCSVALFCCDAVSMFYMRGRASSSHAPAKTRVALHFLL